MHASSWNSWAACKWQECMQEYVYVQAAGMHASGIMHASDRNVGRNACKWQELKGRNASGRNARARVYKGGLE
jgi:hypothetical protein